MLFPAVRVRSHARIAPVIGALFGVEVLTLGIVAAAGLLQVPTPLYGDQALFALGAQSVHDGAVLYRDFWDLKQPGIFWFFAAAHALFGANSVGVHVFELLYQLAFCAVLIGTLRPRFARRRFACCAALFTVGMYYALADARHLTQVEALAGFPLYVALWSALAAARAPHERVAILLAVCAGACSAAVVALKLLFLPIVAASCWLPAVVGLLRRGAGARRAAAVAGALAVAFFTPLIVTAGYFAAHHALGIAWQTTFVIPKQVFAKLPHQAVGVLAESLRWFIHGYAPVIVLAAVGRVFAFRSDRDGLTAGLLLWIAAGSAVIAIQRQSWWSYQLLLIVPPLGILAADGVQALWRLTTRRSWHGTPFRIGIAFAALALFAIPLHAVAVRAQTLAHYGFALRPAERAAYREAVSPMYRSAVASSAFLLEPQHARGSVYVCGDPSMYLIAGRHQPIAINGWLLELLLPSQWQQLGAELRAARPRYVFVSTIYAPAVGPALIPERSPDTARLIATVYRPVRRDPDGTWYARAGALRTHNRGRTPGR